MIERSFLAAVVVAASLLAACSHNRGTQCGEDPRYTRAQTAPPVRIPDDLSPPDETDSLRLPAATQPAGGATASAAAERCLETPPKFGEAGAGRARSAQPAARPAAPAAPAPGDPAAPPPAPGGDREIDN
jgi:hypothetical protein